MTVSSRGAWLDPLNRILWQKAVKDRKTVLTLRDGEKFKVEYSKKLPGKIWVQSMDNFVPCGWFRIDEILNPTWVSGGN